MSFQQTEYISGTTQHPLQMTYVQTPCKWLYFTLTHNTPTENNNLILYIKNWSDLFKVDPLRPRKYDISQFLIKTTINERKHPSSDPE